jgi:hypothetical protein
MDSSEREQVERRLASARRNALEAHLTLARQKAITVQIATSSHDAEVASRMLASLQAVQSAAERDFRNLLVLWRSAGKVGDTEATGRRRRQATPPDVRAL